MKKQRKRSYVLSLQALRKRLKTALEVLREDRINVYAAQAAFFITLSAMPLLMLILTVARMLIPADVTDYIARFIELIPGLPGEYIKAEFLALSSRPSIAPLSISAVMTLWSAARGVKAVRRGIRSVWGCDSGSFIGESLLGVAFTAAFILLLAALLVFLVFGEALSALLAESHPALSAALSAVFTLSPLLFFLLLILFFALMLRAMAPKASGIRRRYHEHLPGACLAAAGWTLYSLLFSLFVSNFSNMSYIYGSLTAVMILMLWLYMIMYILLLGEEFNKLIIFLREKGKPAADP